MSYSERAGESSEFETYVQFQARPYYKHDKNRDRTLDAKETLNAIDSYAQGGSITFMSLLDGYNFEGMCAIVSRKSNEFDRQQEERNLGYRHGFLNEETYVTSSEAAINARDEWLEDLDESLSKHMKSALDTFRIKRINQQPLSWAQHDVALVDEVHPPKIRKFCNALLEARLERGRNK